MSAFDLNPEDSQSDETVVEAAPKRPSKIGITALMLSILGALSTFVLGLLAGLQLAKVPPAVLTELDRRVSNSNTPISQEELMQLISQEHLEIFVAVGVLFGISILLGAVLGVAAIIVAVIALYKKNGRLQAAAAIILSVVYPLIGIATFAAFANLSQV